MTWSAKQYIAFEDERTRPVRDLLAAIPVADARTAVDLGCGPGNSTEALAARYPRARITAIDSSTDMIDSARRRLPEVSFAVAELGDWNDTGPFDIILANAVLQWVPRHEALLAELIAKLIPGGALAVQMPDNLEEPAHRLMRELAAHGPWAVKLSGAAAARPALASADRYYQLMRPLCAKVDLWRTIYYHPLAGGAAAVVEWFKGSGLRPFLEPLNEPERSAFLDYYTAAIARAYPSVADGSVLLPFPRIFWVAIR